MAKVIVVGGGPAGIMAALTASKTNEVILVERNNEIGKMSVWRKKKDFLYF